MNRKKIKEQIKLLYFSPSDLSDLPVMLEERGSYLLKKGDTEVDVISGERTNFLEEQILSFHPDFLIFDFTRNLPDINDFPLHFFSDSRRFGNITLMLFFQLDPGTHVRSKCAENGVEYLLFPFSFSEFDCRIRQILAHRELKQRAAWQDRRMTHAVDHIDKLKGKLQVAEKRFTREKELLHNSLKQINEMNREREHLKKELRETGTALSRNVNGLKDFLSSLIESRDEHRRGHARRVAEIALFVADKIGLEKMSGRELKKAAMLHEVGMLLISDKVLDKDSKDLSRYERDMLELHFLKGAQYLEKCPGFEKTAGIIRHLNEKSDGTGFPEGLKKRYIPLLSRILTGADFLDQLWLDHFDRPDVASSSASSVEYLLTQLEEHAGAKLDPAIVNYLEKYVVTVLGHDRIKLREIAIPLLKPGMVIGTGLFTRTGTKLLTPGTRLTEEIIEMMIRYNREYPVDETVYIKV